MMGPVSGLFVVSAKYKNKQTKSKWKNPKFVLFVPPDAACQRGVTLSQLSQVLCLVSPLGLH